jgi:hypothetical protein
VTVTSGEGVALGTAGGGVAVGWARTTSTGVAVASAGWPGSWFNGAQADPTSSHRKTKLEYRLIITDIVVYRVDLTKASIKIGHKEIENQSTACATAATRAGGPKTGTAGLN